MNGQRGSGCARSRAGWLAVLAAAGVALASPAVVAKTALLVVGNPTLGASDAALKQRLDRYYTTTVRDDDAAAPGGVAHDLVVISGSVAAGAVGTKYRAHPKGVMVLAPAVLPLMAMTGPSGFGTLSGQTGVRMVLASTQLSAGFAADRAVAVHAAGQRIGWGTPVATTDGVAVTANGDRSRAVVFRYLAGRRMVGGFTAPGRRVGFFVQRADALTADGWRLFDHAAEFADGARAPITAGSANAITWETTVRRLARGCDAWTPTWAADDRIYTAWGDCNGVSGTLAPKRSMGLSVIDGHPANGLAASDIATGSIDAAIGGLEALGTGANGRKPSGMIALDGGLYALIRNIRSDGTQSRLRYAPDLRNPNATWRWADWTFEEFGYPSFVQTGRNAAQNGYVYVVAHDGPSAYRAADRFILMRVPAGRILEQNAWELFSGTAAAPAWVSWEQRASRSAIFENKGRSLRNGMSYHPARARYYWWQQIPPTWDSPDSRFFGGFGVYGAPNPWGPWRTVYYRELWDIGPGERGEFPVKWMSSAGIASSGEIYLLFSGDDYLAVRKGTIAPGH